MLEKLESKSFQIHLNGSGMSGRGVRFKLLDPQTKRKSDALAAAMLDPKATNLEFFDARLREGVKTFITEITEQASLKDLMADSPRWHKVSYADLSTAGSEWNLDSGDLFMPADLEALAGFYRFYHEPSETALQKIMGEAKPIA